MSSTAKAKTAKLSEPLFQFQRWVYADQVLVRTLLDYFGSIPDSKETQMKVLQDNIDWAKREKRIFLKHSLETRLIGMCVPPHNLWHERLKDKLGLPANWNHRSSNLRSR